MVHNYTKTVTELITAILVVLLCWYSLIDSDTVIQIRSEEHGSSGVGLLRATLPREGQSSCSITTASTLALQDAAPIHRSRVGNRVERGQG